MQRKEMEVNGMDCNYIIWNDIKCTEKGSYERIKWNKIKWKATNNSKTSSN